jgi:hypothetical protein
MGNRLAKKSEGQKYRETVPLMIEDTIGMHKNLKMENMYSAS